MGESEEKDDIAGAPDDDRFLQSFLPGGSPGLCRLRSKIGLLNVPANRDIIRNVLICGASGTGKNYIAKVIAGHRQWLVSRNTDRADDTVEKPLDTYTGRLAEVSLPGLPDTLVESELFGHEKGSFTGAVNKHTGYFGEEAYEDILLDEIGDASPALQAKLLRVLNSGEYRPVGGTKESESRTSARVLMATNKNLLRMVEKGSFRPDLLWRARECVLFAPPLKDQIDALALIAENILRDLYQRKSAGLGSGYPSLSETDIEFARSYPWPGNVRQLRQALSRWLMYGGSRPLSSIMQEISSETEVMGNVLSTKAGIEEAVNSALDMARVNGTPVAETLDKFIGLFSGRAKRAVYDWLEQSRPLPAELQAMFPGHADANSIRTLIRKWRTKS